MYEMFKVFIESKERNSERTSVEYDRRINEFFKFQFGKEVKDVKVEEVKKLKANDVEVFVSHLLAKGNSNSTIVTKLRSIRSFLKELKRNGVKVNEDITNVKLKKDENHHDALLNMREVNNLFDFTKERKSFPLEQYLFIKLLFTTANRKTATLNMSWSDIKEKFDYQTGEKVWVVILKDKGDKLVKKPIVDDVYNELLALRASQEDDEKIFKNITSDMIRNTMEAFTKHLGDGRNLTIHSIKASALTIAWKMCKDIKKVQQLGGHESISTTEIYIRDEESYFEQLSYVMGKKIDFEKIKTLTHEELLNIIMSNDEIKFAVATKC